jgi:hypothetical protein
MPETEETRDMTVTDEHWTDELEELPARPRRKLLTPLTGALLAVLIAACGFIGGVLVEKNHASPSNPFAAAANRLASAGGRTASGATGAGGAPASRAGGGGGPGGFLFGGGGDSQGQLTVGQVSSLEGRTLYVTTAQGNTVRVKVPKGESVSKTITTSVSSIHPGESVVVQGTKGSGGAINATSVRATPSTSSGSGGGGSSSGRGGGGGGAAVLNQLFGGGGK